MGAFASSSKHMAGVTVRATAIEASTANPYASASGWKNAPDRPPRKKIGTKTMASIRVA